MFGPRLLVDTLTKPVTTKPGGDKWQYLPRGDRHSKAACWGILFDLLLSSRLLRSQVEAGRVAFGINHEMRDFRQNRKKDLDLVLCTPGPGEVSKKPRTFAALAKLYDLELAPEAVKALAQLPTLSEAPVGAVLVALEAKACMTAHVKAIPRLFDELNSSHLTVHGAAETAIAAGFVMVNTAKEFASPGRFGYCPNCGHRVAPMNEHRQPSDAIRVIDKVKELPRRSSSQGEGFDSLGIVAVDCRNDGSPVRLVTEPPAPQPGDIFHYDQMILRLAQLYDGRFANV